MLNSKWLKDFSQNRLVRGGIGLGLLRVASTLLAFVVGVLLTRQLGSSGYGTYAFAMSLASLASMLSEFGIPMLALREFGAAQSTRNWDKVKGLTQWADRVIVGLSLSILAVLWIARILWREIGDQDSDLSILMLATLLVPATGIARFRGFALLAQGFPFLGQFPVLVLRPAVFASLLAIFLVLRSELTPWNAMLLQVLAATVALAVLVLLFSKKQTVDFRAASPRYDTRSWVASCIPFGLTEGLRSLGGQLGVLLLGLLATSADVGVFRVALTTANLTMIATAVVTVLISPRIAKLNADGDKARMQRLAGLAAWAIFATNLVASVPLIVFGDSLLPFVFGPDFSLSSTALKLLLIGNLIAALGGPARSLANMIGHERLTTQSAALGLSSQLVLSLSLIPIMGANGAALATICSACLANFFAAFMLSRKALLDSTVFAVLGVWGRARS